MSPTPSRPSAGIHILPFMSPADVVRIAEEADRIGYDYCLIADEGLLADVYACLGAVARATSRIRIGAMTNGYTRHPGTTAAAIASVHDLSDGRALVTMLAGGSMTLAPFGLERRAPFQVVADAVTAMRSLWSGETVTWEGATCSLREATLAGGPRMIPIWIATRGPMLLTLAGQQAEGVLLTVKPDLAAALATADAAAADVGRAEPPTKVYLGRVCYTPEMLEQQRRTLPYVLFDSPQRVFDSLGFDDDERALVARAAAEHRPELLEALMTDDLLRRYQVAGTPAECTAEVRRLVAEHHLDALLVDVMSTDLDENLQLLHDSYPILTGGTR